MLVPTFINVNKWTNVIAKPKPIRDKAAKNLPNINSISLMGIAEITSIVPEFFSLAIKLHCYSWNKKDILKELY